MSARNGLMRRYIVQLWIDPAAHVYRSCPADSVVRLRAVDPADAGARAFAQFPDCAVADVYSDTQNARFHGTQRVAP